MERGPCLEGSELPSPFWARILEPLAFSMGLVLRLFQIAMKESPISMIKSGLRVVIAAA
jgi:hypothetical protein